MDCSVTVGNRHPAFVLIDGSGNYHWVQPASAVSTALQTAHVTASGMVAPTSQTLVIAGVTFLYQNVPLPDDLWIPVGSTLQFIDLAAVDAGGDFFLVNYQIERWKDTAPPQPQQVNIVQPVLGPLNNPFI
jgi:hypothetical protein